MEAQREQLVLSAWREAVKTHGKDERFGDCLRRCILGAGMTSEELMEWLFVVPAPHGCLAILDDIISGKEDEAAAMRLRVEDDEWASLTDPKLIKCIIFGEIDRMGVPKASDLTLMVKRMMQALRMAENVHFAKISYRLCSALQYAWRVDHSAPSFISNVLRSPDSDLLLGALRILSTGVPVAEDMSSIRELLHHHEEEVRMLAIKVASKFVEAEPSNVEALAQLFWAVLQHDPSGKVRASVFRQSIFPHVVSQTQELLPLVLACMEDEDSAVAIQATLAMSSIVEIGCRAGINLGILPPLATLLTKLVMWPVEAKTLTDLCIDTVVGHLTPSDQRVASLPQDLQTLIKPRWNSLAEEQRMKRYQRALQSNDHFTEEAAILMDVEGDDPDWKPTLRQAAAICMEEVCILPNIFMNELLPVIKSRLRHDVTWQVRESGIFMLGIFGASVRRGDDLISEVQPAIEAAWACTEFIKDCLFDPEAKVRSISSWSLGRLFLAQNLLPMQLMPDDDVKERKKRCIHALAKCLMQEQNPLAFEAQLSGIIELMEHGEMDDETDEFKVGLIDECISLYPRLASVNSKSLVFDLFDTWIEHFSSDTELVQRGLAAIIPFIKSLPPYTPSDLVYPAIVSSIDRMITGGNRNIGTYLTPISQLLKRNLLAILAYLTAPKKEEEELSVEEMEQQEKQIKAAHDSLSACFGCMSELLERDFRDVLLIVPASELIRFSAAAFKMRGQGTDDLKANAAALLGDLSPLASDDLIATPAATKQMIFEFILATLTQDSHADNVMHNALWALDKLAFYAPSMIDESWVATLIEKLCLNSRFELLPEPVAGLAMLQLGNRFASSMAAIARKAITSHPSGWQFDRAKEKVGAIVGWTHLARLAVLPSTRINEASCFSFDSGRMTAKESVESCINLLHIIVNVVPRFLTPTTSGEDDEDEEDDGKAKEAMSEEEKEEYERIIKDAARSAIRTLLHNELLASLTPENIAHVIPYTALPREEERDRISAATKELLPPGHPLAQLLLAAPN